MVLIIPLLTPNNTSSGAKTAASPNIVQADSRRSNSDSLLKTTKELYRSAEKKAQDGEEGWPVVLKNVPFEKAALQDAKQKLGFDPCTEAEKLTGKHKSLKKNAKLVLKDGLDVEPDSEREDACWQTTDLDVLRERGMSTFLTAYLGEVAERLAPVFSE